ncbi:MAG: CDP-archaeol synthase [Bacteroidetes bacterium]|nr:MAG: CDP-archaeol synthase [Bacteroidota bacterium]
MKNLLTRSITGIVFVGSILLSILLDPIVFAIVMGLYLFGALWEYCSFFILVPQVHLPIKLFIGVAMTLYLLLSGIACWLLDWQSVIFIIPILLFYVLSEIWRKKEHPLLNVSAGIFGIFYLVIPFLLTVILVRNSFPGLPLAIGMFVLIWTNDSFAYLSGRFIGKTPLFERISPKKTWEGTLGGVLFTILAALILAHFFERGHSYLFWVVAAILISAASMIGDLFESMIKRSLNIKDSGNVLPGHGGILDRFDAMIIAAPLYFFWWLFYAYLSSKFGL